MDFTQEQKDEIRASYRDAKNPEKQISVLVDLYACTKNDIMQVLELQKGLDGLGDFILAFYGVEFITESDQRYLDEILLKAEGFIAGVKAAKQ